MRLHTGRISVRVLRALSVCFLPARRACQRSLLSQAWRAGCCCCSHGGSTPVHWAKHILAGCVLTTSSLPLFCGLPSTFSLCFLWASPSWHSIVRKRKWCLFPIYWTWCLFPIYFHIRLFPQSEPLLQVGHCSRLGRLTAGRSLVFRRHVSSQQSSRVQTTGMQ